MFLVGPLEELCKFLVFFVIVRKLKSIREPIDGILQAATVGLAFASVENVFYSLWYGPQVFWYRSIFSIAGHMVNASIWGLSFVLLTMAPGKSNRLPFRRMFIAILFAGFAHGLYNWLLLFDTGYALLLDAILIISILSIYNYALKKSPFRPAKPTEYRNTIPSILYSLNANPTDIRLNYKLALNYIYARKYDAALAALDVCMVRRAESNVLAALRGVIHILKRLRQLGEATLEGALSCMDEKQLDAFDKLCRHYVRDRSTQILVSRMVAARLTDFRWIDGARSVKPSFQHL